MTIETLDADKLALALTEILGTPSQTAKPLQSDKAEPAGQKKNFLPYHSQSVPKSENLKAGTEVKATHNSLITTMMLRNIPNKYTQNTLLQEIDECGFAGSYNFFYLPMDVHNRSNVGYAFINFIKPADAERFRIAFGEHRFQKYQSRKISSACAAHVQGLDDNLRHFENRAVTHARNDQYRPIVFKGNQRIDFEEAVAAVRVRSTAAMAAATGGDQTSITGRAYKNTAQRSPAQPLAESASHTNASQTNWEPKAGGRQARQRERRDLQQQNLVPPGVAEPGVNAKDLQSLNHDLEVVRQLCQRLPPEGVLAARDLLNQHVQAISSLTEEPMRVGEAPPGLPMAAAPRHIPGTDTLGSHLNQLVSLRQLLMDQMQLQKHSNRNDGTGVLAPSHTPKDLLEQGPAYVNLPTPSMYPSKCGVQDLSTLGVEGEWAFQRTISSTSTRASTSSFSVDALSGA